MKIKLLPILLAVSILFGCQSIPERENIAVDINATDTHEYTIVEVIPLMADSIMIGQNWKANFNKNYYIINDKNNVFVYEKSGKLHCTFSPKGRGANEVYSLQMLSVTEEYIEIFDLLRRKYLRYDFCGNYLSSGNLPANTNEYIFLGDLLITDSQSSGDRILSLYNENLKLITDTLEARSKGLNYGSSKFQRDGNQVLYLPSFYDKIFSISTDGKIEIPYSFDFGLRWATPEECQNHADPSNIFGLWNYMKEHDKIGFLKFIKNDKWIVLNFEYKDDTYNWYYNTESKSQFSHKKSDIVLGKKITSHDGFFFALYDAIDYVSDFGQANGVHEEDNPVLVKFILK